ncbi:MAG: hypothetical protein HC881_24630 [Leptolyngbyaceae cyanobacterium SL_7_1]|nr:hypothetical protein [Leptolyngbyaceae cyanobacterium SL_7_1]
MRSRYEEIAIALRSTVSDRVLSAVETQIQVVLEMSASLVLSREFGNVSLQTDVQRRQAGIQKNTHLQAAPVQLG